MAQRITLDLNHSLYEQTKLSAGKPPDIDTDAQPFSRLIHNGDSVLDNAGGVFFETIDGKFIICYQQKKRSDTEPNTSVRGKERYINLFSADIDSVQKLKLSHLTDRLWKATVPFGANPKNPLTVKIEALGRQIERTGEAECQANEDEFHDVSEVHSAGPTGVSNESDPTAGNRGDDQTDGAEIGRDDEPKENIPTTDPTESTSLDPAKLDFVAEFWEHYRRKDMQLRADLQDLDIFRSVVDDTLRNINYVSNERKANSYFDVVNGTWDQEIDNKQLKQKIRHLHKQGQLTFNQLPSYEDLLEERKQAMKNRLRDPPEHFESKVEELIENLQKQIEALAEIDANSRPRLFEEAYSGQIDTDSKNGRLSGIKEIIVGENIDEEIFEDLETGTIEDETVERLAHELLAHPDENGLIANKQQIVNNFNDSLERLVEIHRRQLLQEIIEGIYKIKTSEVYKRAKSEGNSD